MIGKRICLLPGCTKQIPLAARPDKLFCCPKHAKRFRARFGPGGLHNPTFRRYVAERKREMAKAWERGYADS